MTKETMELEKLQEPVVLQVQAAQVVHQLTKPCPVDLGNCAGATVVINDGPDVGSRCREFCTSVGMVSVLRAGFCPPTVKTV